MSALSVVGGSRRRIQLWCLAFVIPGIVLGGLFTFYPMVMSWYYSLVQWNGFCNARTFIGLRPVPLPPSISFPGRAAHDSRRPLWIFAKPFLTTLSVFTVATRIAPA